MNMNRVVLPNLMSMLYRQALRIAQRTGLEIDERSGIKGVVTDHPRTFEILDCDLSNMSTDPQKIQTIHLRLGINHRISVTFFEEAQGHKVMQIFLQDNVSTGIALTREIANHSFSPEELENVGTRLFVV